MFYLVWVWSLLFFICFGIGFTVLGFLKVDCFENRTDHLIASIWLGITLLSVMLLSVSLFLPLSFAVTLPIVVSLMAWSWLNKRIRAEIVHFCSLNTIILCLTLALTVAFFIAKEVTWYDSGLYHVGKIHWLVEYGHLPGLYLIQDRFGWTSSWFALSALLNPPFVEYRATAAANGFLVFITFLHFFFNIRQIAIGKARLASWFVTIAYLILLPILMWQDLPLTNSNNSNEEMIFPLDQAQNLIAKIVISPSHDIPVILMAIVIGWIMLVIAERKSESASVTPMDVRIIPLLLAAGATTMKLTGIALLFVALPFYYFSKKFWWQRILWGALISFLLLTPMFAAGIITSACPLFPSLFMCLDLPWSTYPPQLYDIGLWWRAESLLGHPSGDENVWWWLLSEWINKNNVNMMIAVYLILALILLTWLLIFHRDKLPGLGWILLLGVVGMALIFTQAPDTRYGLGYFLLIPCSIIGAFCYCLTYNSPDIDVGATLLPISLTKHLSSAYLSQMFSLGLVAVLSFQGIRESRFLLPPQLPQVEPFRDRVNKIEYFQPLPPDLCWGSKLPCAHGFLPHSVKLRKPEQGIKGGFRGSRPATDWLRRR